MVKRENSTLWLFPLNLSFLLSVLVLPVTPSSGVRGDGSRGESNQGLRQMGAGQDAPRKEENGRRNRDQVNKLSGAVGPTAR